MNCPYCQQKCANINGNEAITHFICHSCECIITGNYYSYCSSFFGSYKNKFFLIDYLSNRDVTYIYPMREECAISSRIATQDYLIPIICDPQLSLGKYLQFQSVIKLLGRPLNPQNVSKWLATILLFL